MTFKYVALGPSPGDKNGILTFEDCREGYERFRELYDANPTTIIVDPYSYADLLSDANLYLSYRESGATVMGLEVKKQSERFGTELPKAIITDGNFEVEVLG